MEMKLDQYIKEIMVDFLPEMMALFFPELFDSLDFASKKDLNRDLYTDSPEGEERFVDLLLEVRFKNPPAFFLIHIESQQENRFDFPARMLGYDCLLYAREFELQRRADFTAAQFTAWQNEKELLSVVFCHYPLVEAISRQTYTTPWRYSFVSCGYIAISFPMLSAEDYLQKDNSLVCAIAIFMNPGSLSKVELKLACYRKLLDYQAQLTEKQIADIFYGLENYLILSEEEKQTCERLLRELYPEVSEMITNPFIERGRQEGIQQGIQEMLLHQLEVKFGAVPESALTQVRAMSGAQLTRLSERLLDATTLAEMGFDGQPARRAETQETEQ
jgi:hypothetical protein